MLIHIRRCRAPEQTDAEFGARGSHSDVWGFAATMLHLATGDQPYKDLTVVQMISAMVKAKPPSVPVTLPAWLQHLLKQCFSFEVTKRLTVLQLLQVKSCTCRLGRVKLTCPNTYLETCAQIFKERLKGPITAAPYTSSQQVPSHPPLPQAKTQQMSQVLQAEPHSAV